MTELCLIRHGETDWNAQHRIQGRSDIPLNSKGIEQAETVSAHFHPGEWDLAYASPLQRARQTAEIICRAAGIREIATEDDLMECSFGIAEGHPFDPALARYSDRESIPGAESAAQLSARAQRVLDRIADRHPGKRIIVVAHGCFIMESLYTLSAGQIDGRNIHLENLALSCFRHDQGRWSIPWYNHVVDKKDPAGVS